MSGVNPTVIGVITAGWLIWLSGGLVRQVFPHMPGNLANKAFFFRNSPQFPMMVFLYKGILSLQNARRFQVQELCSTLPGAGSCYVAEATHFGLQSL